MTNQDFSSTDSNKQVNDEIGNTANIDPPQDDIVFDVEADDDDITFDDEVDNSPAAMLRRAREHMVDDEDEQAMDIVKEILRIDKNNIEALWMYARLHTDDNKIKASLKQLLKLDPSHDKAKKMLQSLSTRDKRDDDLFPASNDIASKPNSEPFRPDTNAELERERLKLERERLEIERERVRTQETASLAAQKAAVEAAAESNRKAAEEAAKRAENAAIQSSLQIQQKEDSSILERQRMELERQRLEVERERIRSQETAALAAQRTVDRPVAQPVINISTSAVSTPTLNMSNQTNTNVGGNQTVGSGYNNSAMLVSFIFSLGFIHGVGHMMNGRFGTGFKYLIRGLIWLGIVVAVLALAAPMDDYYDSFAERLAQTSAIAVLIVGILHLLLSGIHARRSSQRVYGKAKNDQLAHAGQYTSKR